MRVVKVNIPDLPKFGLKSIHMERLGGVVVLAGKNGAGKSRLLGRLVGWTKDRIVPFGPLSEWERHVPPPILAESKTKPFWKDLTVQKWIAEATNNMPSWDEMYDLEFEGEGTPTFVHFIPKKIEISDTSKMTPLNLKQFASRLDSVGIDNLHIDTTPRIQLLQNQWHAATHQRSTLDAAAKTKAIEQYESLNSIIAHFLGTQLSRNINNEATLFNFPIGEAQLSDGQKILLQFCAAVHAQAGKLSELIVLMDEPENHLHPAAMLDAITVIERALPNGQLWIATHSVPLLAHFDPETIWWMHDGTVQHAGSQPETVLRGLIGDDERIDRLGDFLGLPAALAASNFAHQCLLPPAVLTTDSTDPQTTQIARVLNAHRPGQMLRLLDFGAGRGRLVSALRDSGSDSEGVKTRIDYRAYDSSTTYREDCEAAIARLYGTADHRFFFQEKDLRAQLDAHSVDVIVMCNVLHEVDPLHWLALFSERGLIRQLLHPDGFLLLVEDMEMRVGEKAHQRGFLVMDTADLKAFFGITEIDTEFQTDDARGNGRLKAHLIPAACLGRANNTTLRATLNQVKHLAGQEITVLRSKEPSYREGRRHALYVHQLANASLVTGPHKLLQGI